MISKDPGSSGAGGDDWDTHWDKYAASATINPAQDLRHRAILDGLRHGNAHYPRLLDIGSGQGDFLAKAIQADVADAYAGFELSASGVRISQQKLPQASFVHADLFAPPPEVEPYRGWASAAVCSDVIEHVDDPIAFLRGASTYLEPGALLVLTVPGGPMSTFDKHIGHRQHFTDAKVRAVLGGAGFLVEDVRLAGFPFFNLYRLLVILRGAKLIADVESSDGEGAASGAARIAMSVFSYLFRFNVRSASLGWQVVATARKST
jgi:SAM-dependent methyltransferase